MCYLFFHFQYRDGEPELEQIQFSISRNGLDWILLNGGKPVIENHGDDGGLRDPFLFRKSDGSFSDLGMPVLAASHGILAVI